MTTPYSCATSPLPSCSAYLQKGQAAVEALVVLLVLLSLWVGIAWLLRFQDIALQAQHASRYAAFSLGRHVGLRPVGDIRRRYFSGAAHQWVDRGGHHLLDPAQVSLQMTRHQKLGVVAQAGGALPDAVVLRRGWQLEDAGIVRAQVLAAPHRPERHLLHKAGGLNTGLSQFDSWYPALSRHTAILVGAGHSSGDQEVQRRVAESGLGWSDNAADSYRLGRQVQSAVQALDRPWNRGTPEFDWLSSWVGFVPARHLYTNQEGP
ncbi:MAG: pilus assembly protein [Candidimonas sp.]|nr:MAG: pilus assembly protein [Candidimonas sp.]TAM26295.1 MAG: pilus assembly protein [Candidimonas sp.]TAM75127.1 MAG: pilus assembly protein [Candidimonas sp.]